MWRKLRMESGIQRRAEKALSQAVPVLEIVVAEVIRGSGLTEDDDVEDGGGGGGGGGAADCGEDSGDDNAGREGVVVRETRGGGCDKDDSVGEDGCEG
ncbi:hypothetical protein EJ06DRAFT_301088 [Trichodelitschia bisporula]|uniref:Uncharacterized protein n=1 Tax=Trichodelitschia bisporula TaxID=703511 RepID=A0A6G1I6R1_9PEZI|nr:hypothetical protein EJ06DRAFT_301088 [Trichodelitschia bisporula]